MSLPELEVVDQTAGMQFGFTAQPSVFAGCGPLLRMSTLFCAAAGATLSKRIAPQKNDKINLFIFRLMASRSHVMAKQLVATLQTTPMSCGEMKPSCLLEPKSVPVWVELVAERSSTGIDGVVRGSEMPVVVLRLSHCDRASLRLPLQGR